MTSTARRTTHTRTSADRRIASAMLLPTVRGGLVKQNINTPFVYF